MNELFDRYLTDHAEAHKKPRSIEQDRRLIDVHLRTALGAKKIIDVARADIASLHKKLAETPYQANRALALLSKAMNLAESWGLRPDGSNPCRHVKKYREKKRERFLSAQELARLGETLAAAEFGEVTFERESRSGGRIQSPISPNAIAAIRLLIFTGARRDEILSLRWDYVNFDQSRLELPDSKTGAKFIYLPAPALAILSGLPRKDGNPHVIVGAKDGAHLVNLKDPWSAIRNAAGLSDVRIHDLRHSFASVAAGGGMSLPVIGALLGHKDTATTARYAHLSDDPLRAAVNTIGSKIADAMGVASNGPAPDKEVVSLK
jgi:integrase